MGPFYCYQCNRKIFFVPGDERGSHFRHYPKSEAGEDPDCDERVNSYEVIDRPLTQRPGSHLCPRPHAPDTWEEGEERGSTLPRIRLNKFGEKWQLSIDLPPIANDLYKRVFDGIRETAGVEVHLKGVIGSRVGRASFYELRPNGPGRRLFIPPAPEGYTLHVNGLALTLDPEWNPVVGGSSDCALFRILQGEWSLVPKGAWLRWGERLLLTLGRTHLEDVEYHLSISPAVHPLGEGFRVVEPVQLPAEEDSRARAWLERHGYRVALPAPRLRMGTWPTGVQTVGTRQEFVYPVDEPLYVSATQLPFGHPLCLEITSEGRRGLERIDLPTDATESAFNWQPANSGRHVARLDPDGSKFAFHCLPLPSPDLIRQAMSELPRLWIEVEGQRRTAFSAITTVHLKRIGSVPPIVQIGFAGMLPGNAAQSINLRISVSPSDGRYLPPRLIPAERASKAIAQALVMGAQRVVVDGSGLGSVVIQQEPEAVAHQHRLAYWAEVVRLLNVPHAAILDRALRLNHGRALVSGTVEATQTSAQGDIPTLTEG